MCYGRHRDNLFTANLNTSEFQSIFNWKLYTSPVIIRTMLSWNTLSWITHHVKTSHNQKISTVPLKDSNKQVTSRQFLKQGNKIQFVTEISKRNTTFYSIIICYRLWVVIQCNENHVKCPPLHERHFRSTSVGKVILVHILRHIPIWNIKKLDSI